MRLGPAIAVIAALALSGCRSPASEGRAEFLGSYEWAEPEDWFGGFSAVEVSPDGSSMLVLSDKARLARATLTRTDGLISEVELGPDWPLKSSQGKPLAGRIIDSEGLAVAPNGDIHVSFEGVHRVATYSAPDAPARVLTRKAMFRGIGLNKSLEALARDADGRLYTLPEDGRDAAGRIPVFCMEDGQWSVPFSLDPSEGFLPVAADFGPDGRFYLLERGFSVLGFRSQLRRWEIGPDGPTQATVLFRTAYGTHDNLEGLSVWRDDMDRLRATMISDDNFKFFQRTELVEYGLPD